MGTDDQVIFQPGMPLKLQWAAVVFLACTLVICYVEYHYAFGVGITMGLTVFLIKGPRYALTRTTLVASYGYRRLVLPLEGSEFHVQRIAGLRSWRSCLKADGYLLRVKVPGGRECRFAPVLTREDGDDMLALLRERATVVEE